MSKFDRRIRKMQEQNLKFFTHERLCRIRDKFKVFLEEKRIKPKDFQKNLIWFNKKLEENAQNQEELQKIKAEHIETFAVFVFSCIEFFCVDNPKGLWVTKSSVRFFELLENNPQTLIL